MSGFSGRSNHAIARTRTPTDRLVRMFVLFCLIIFILMDIVRYATETKLIDDSKRAKPRYEQGLVSGKESIVRQEGLAGIYQGVVPVVMRQGSASAIRLGTYSALRDWLPKAHGSGSSLINWLATFSIGAASGVVAVYGTMPFDVLKTRMQAIDAARYRSTWHCLTNTLKTEGAAALWRGSVSRSMRLIVSGGVIFSVYEQVVWLLAGPES